MKFIRQLMSAKQKERAAGTAPPESPDQEQLIRQLVKTQDLLRAALKEARAPAFPTGSGYEDLQSGLAVIATNAWKARTKMTGGGTNEPREEMRRVYRHIEAMFDAFQQMGLQVRDHIGEEFDYGLPLTVLTTQPTPGLAKERVIETIKPTIYWHETMIQAGEVVIATPA